MWSTEKYFRWICYYFIFKELGLKLRNRKIEPEIIEI